MLWLLWKVYHNWVVYHKIQMHSFLKVESLGKTRCRKSWNQFKGVRFTKFTLRHASIREKKGPSLGKIQVKLRHPKSLRNKIRRSVPWRDWKTRAMCPKQGLGSCQKIYKLNANGKATFFSPAEKWVLPNASAREPEERQFVVHSGASMHMVSKKDLNSAELETMRTSRSPTKMRSKASSECKAEQVKDCRTKSLKTWRKRNTKGQKKPWNW